MQQGPSVAYMKGQEGALISLLARKRLVLGWTYYLFVLAPNSRKIYQYRSELVSYACYAISLLFKLKRIEASCIDSSLESN